jgi:hypothetical protein
LHIAEIVSALKRQIQKFLAMLIHAGGRRSDLRLQQGAR